MLTCGADPSLPSVPRSKGCLTCVSRKTRCDGRRPTCRNCEERKQVCRGYRRRDIVFLSDGWRAPGVAASERKKKLPARTEEYEPLESGTYSPGVLIPHSDFCPQKGPNVDRRQLYIAFFLSEFGPAVLSGPHLIFDLFYYYASIPITQTYTDTIHYLSPSWPVVLAVHALAEARFGRANADLISTQQSVKIYGMALRSMSAKLTELHDADSGFRNLSEGDWQHLVFFCIVMACWELEMFPTSKMWQNHIRGLAAAIMSRGTEHAYSDNNLRLLAASRLFIILQTLSWRRPTFLSDSSRHGQAPIHSEFTLEIRAAQHELKYPIATLENNLQSLDHLIMDVSSTAAVASKYDQLLANMSGVAFYSDSDSGKTLINLYNEAETLLFRIEMQLACWDTAICETPLAVWLSNHQNASAGFWSTVGLDLRYVVDTVLSFRSMREYQIFTLQCTAAMFLRLLISDMLALTLTTGLHATFVNPYGNIERHRVKLMGYAQRILRTIGYGVLKESRLAAPFFLATAFQMATVITERECEILKAQNGDRGLIKRCEDMRCLAIYYMNWATRDKISIKMDVSPPY
ncbi:hypothetical protein F5Y00DRAFT_122026 [Daldinia vernicosa]|uniref:uncharacterized protein n=1 Tax=Daldinia vernicosa TaxID=114800 RepID=UPI002008E2AE|nr:uncharacterized protein F5Y00DRAFT_122026 [Daldinia vernicosa]KAI0847157.1 hypothetical protein F5Y00DRAFT_122026 [Daldinia vernicosa]